MVFRCLVTWHINGTFSQIEKNNPDDVNIASKLQLHTGGKINLICYLSLSRLEGKKIIFVDI